MTRIVMRIVGLLLLGAACCVLSCASVGPEQTSGSVRSGISGGQPDSQDANVFLLVSHRGTAGVALCSASLIAPNLLLTARHCVSDTPEGHVMCGQTMASPAFAANTLYAANSATEDTVTAAYQVSDVSVPVEGSDICGFDLALLTLKTVVSPSVATPLVPRIDRPVSAHERYSAVGFGSDSPSEAGVAGVRRDRTGLQVDCVPGSCGQGVESSEFVGGPGICSGDSGGPALDAAGKVVGVASRSGDDCAHPVYGSVASWKDWLISVAEQAAVQGNYDAPSWVETGLSDPPPDAGDAADAAGGAGGGNLAGKQGEKCTGPEGCQPTFGCYSPTSSATDAYCAAYCSEQSQCPSGTTCQPGVKACVENPRADPGSSSCAVSTPGQLGGSANRALLSLLAIVAASRRRLRSRAERRTAR